MRKKGPQRSDDQKVTAFSLPLDLFEEMESLRKKKRLDRSNFIRFCIAEYIDSEESRAEIKKEGCPKRLMAAEGGADYAVESKGKAS